MRPIRLPLFALVPALLVLVLCAPLAPAAEQSASPVFIPDPATIQREGPAYRYPQAGWVVLHIEGSPYERGYQHGKLMSREIADYVKCFAECASPKGATDAWRLTRTTANALFLRRYDREYLDEMRGIADGAADGGAKYDGRPIDTIDIVALNAWPELMTLNEALSATPTGQESTRFSRENGRSPTPSAAPGLPEPGTQPAIARCSAFAATGPATADGKIVFGHITMFDLYPSTWLNVWLDVKPTTGHRVVMQSFPGGIDSGTDYYINDAGIMVCETTLKQTQFDGHGMALASRIRHAVQYANNIDDVCTSLTSTGNNGLYTNEWLIGDAKINEIAMFELGTAKTRLWRSSRNEWFGDTPGFYWGCNNTKDLQVRLETEPTMTGTPADPTFTPQDRDMLWVRLYKQDKGHIDEAFARRAFSTPPLVSSFSADAKFTTSAMALHLQSWNLFGNTTGRTWKPTDSEKRDFPSIQPMVSNPWTPMAITPPPATQPAEVPKQALAVDLKSSGADDADDSSDSDKSDDKPDDQPPRVPAWRGTVLPATDGDVWLPAALARYQRIVGRETTWLAKQDPKPLTPAQRDRLAVRLFAARSEYLSAVRQLNAEPAITAVHFDAAHNEWHRIAEGRGVLVLAELDKFMTDPVFTDAMDRFCSAHAGKSVTTADFFNDLARVNQLPAGFVQNWVARGGLPTLRLSDAGYRRKAAAPGSDSYTATGTVQVQGAQPIADVDVTVETGDDETTQFVAVHDGKAKFSIDTENRPTRIVVNKYLTTAAANGNIFSPDSFYDDTDHTLIIYGTRDEAAANHEAALQLQQAVADGWLNALLPIKSDAEVSDSDLRSNHLLLIGRPAANRITSRFADAIPVVFGSASAVVRGKTYAAPTTALIISFANPANDHHSATVIAGLSAAATYRAATQSQDNRWGYGDCRIITDQKTTDLVLAAPELTKDFPAPLPDELGSSTQPTTAAASR